MVWILKVNIAKGLCCKTKAGSTSVFKSTLILSLHIQLHAKKYGTYYVDFYSKNVNTTSAANNIKICKLHA